MGNNCCQERRIKRQRLALLLVGLDNAGKTVTAKGLAGEPFTYPVPTVGFSVIELQFKHYDVKIFDLGGGQNIRGIWYKYFVDVHGVIFVVDSCDTGRFEEAKEVLEEILSSDKIMGKPLLILANKQDQESALDEIDIIECLNIEQLANKYKCPTLVQSCSASESNLNKLDPGIKEGYEWILNYVDKNYGKLNIRVQIDLVEQEIKDKEELLQKIQRIKAEREALKQTQDPDAIQTYSEYVSKLNKSEDTTVENSPAEPDSNSSTSSITFPAIYHIRGFTTERERPKSAMQIVKHQLQMNGELRRSHSAKNRQNKTAPMYLFESKEFMPRTESAKVGEITFVKPQRVVKTADERLFTISKRTMGPGGDYYAPISREGFELKGQLEIKKLSPLRVKSNAQVNQENGTNGICVIDVD